MWGSLKPKYLEKKLNPKHLEKKENTKKNHERLGRGTLNACAKFQGLTLKNGVDIRI